MVMLGHIDTARHPIDDLSYVAECHETLERDGALVLPGFFTEAALATVLEQSMASAHQAYFTTDTHNVYLTEPDDALGADHVFNRQITSTKGCITDDQVAAGSPLRDVYDSVEFRTFLTRVLDIEEIHPYADDVSSINVHFHHDGQELGWHFDNSSFAVTMLVQPPVAGGVFEYVPELRDSSSGDRNYEGVRAALDGEIVPLTLDIEPGALVLFRGRDSMHRITPSHGDRTRVLVVFAYNTEPGIGLSKAARATFYGR